jgi:hypothetical protein
VLSDPFPGAVSSIYAFQLRIVMCTAFIQGTISTEHRSKDRARDPRAPD